MTPPGERVYEENKHKSGLYSYEKPLAALSAEEVAMFRTNRPAWVDWEKRWKRIREKTSGPK